MKKDFGGLGFCHFHGFNLAMLRKKALRFATNKDAIVTKIFKAKYFPMGSFLDAPLGNNPSFIWRDIRASQVLIKSGFKWRIGNGHLIMCGINLGLNMAGILMS